MNLIFDVLLEMFRSLIYIIPPSCQREEGRGAPASAHIGVLPDTSHLLLLLSRALKECAKAAATGLLTTPIIECDPLLK